MVVGTEIVEQDAGEDGAEFASGGADAVGEAAYAGGEDFAGNDEGGGVGAEVEEELMGNGKYECFWNGVGEEIDYLCDCEADEFGGLENLHVSFPPHQVKNGLVRLIGA